eukprot:CAMPEP_0170188428 /NCGR_PEP_ID=MMETSP0040_2-20121228/44325_1 /TAXON_ID=641309 /ORGANISM="Lotharella oceanica, Strain CCMP622" /LENGTH=160 /DNA_ID=CAMNT_0010435735 /DNA_START=183 /DNA_END=665 /DNA_ORIENTATION=+
MKFDISKPMGKAKATAYLARQRQPELFEGWRDALEERDNGMSTQLRSIVSRKHFKANRPFLMVIERKDKIVMLSEIQIAPHPGTKSHKIEPIRDYTWGTSCALADDPLTDEDEDFLEVALERTSKDEPFRVVQSLDPGVIEPDDTEETKDKEDDSVDRKH